MAFSGHYFCGCKKDTPSDIDKVPLYYLPEDIISYCDAAVRVSAPGAYLGHLWAPAKDPSLSDSYNGYVKIDEQPGSLVHNFSGNSRADDIADVTIHGGANGTIIKSLSCTVNFSCSYGAKSDGWCGTRIYMMLDGTALNSPHHIVKSWGGTRSLSYTVNNIKVPSGDHKLHLSIQTHASHGDGAYFRVNWYSFFCDPIQRYQIPSNMHIFRDSDNKEYILCKNFGEKEMANG